MNDVPYAFEMSKIENAKYASYHKSKTSFASHKILKLLMVLIIFALIIEIAYYFMILPITSTAKFVFEINASSLTEKEIKKIIGVEEGVKWSSIDSSNIASILKSYPLVEHVAVKKRFPDKVYISLTERRPIAVSFVNIDGSIVPLEIDKEGVVFRMGWQEKTSTLTILSGIEFQNPKIGMKVHHKLVSLFNRLDFISKSNPLLLAGISEVKVREKKYGDYDLVIYPTYSKIKVISNKELSENTLNRMILILDVLKTDVVAREIEYVDIRGANIVYKWKEISK